MFEMLFITLLSTKFEGKPSLFLDNINLRLRPILNRTSDGLHLTILPPSDVNDVPFAIALTTHSVF
nr:hypothetical protein [Aliivibrio fischeri]